MTDITKKRGLFFCSLFLITLIFSTKSLAQSYETKEGDSINPRVYVTAGYYFPSINTSLRIDGRLGLGTEIGLEDLGLEEDKSVFKLGGVVRVSPKSQLAISYTSINRNASATLERDITIGETTFEAGSGLSFKFNVDYYALTWRYSFFNEKNWNAGLSLGARAVSINTGFNARVNSRFLDENTSVTAPAILFGVHGSAYLTPKLLARYSLEYFYLSVNGIDINVVESNASVEYFFFKKFGLGLAYSTNDYLVRDVPLGEDFNGKIDFNFGGFNLFLSGRF
ncbi:hypothetical protein [uncultured Algibacter sp.]|uniref:hypothetical protein n=1 Tax=uncultured Algibacter sp. TaxID=298659 RepID=UPI0026086322|nr:hypothetical protein [uncultured Algibacter sp.]